MTGTGAVTELANRVFGTGIFIPLMRAGFVVIGMAGGAGTRVDRVTIALNDLTIVCVTRTAPYIRIMVARVFWSRMTEVVGWCPALRGMAGVALRRGVKMTLRSCWWLPRRVSSVVTIFADTGATAVVRPGAAHKSCGSMTSGAIQAGLNMRRIGLGIHAGGRNSMARRTIIDDTGMVESCRDETNRIMADTTVLIGRNMIEFFRGGETAIMARDAVVHDPCMIKGRR